MDLNTISFLLLGFLVTGYAILDGFDLGVGTLSLFTRSKEERDLHVACIGPVWDGNQVWLLTTGNVLFCAFPLVFTTVFSGFYLPFILLLAALIGRAVGVEFRQMHPSSRWVRFWDGAYGAGSLAAALLLGIVVGNLLRGVPIGPGYTWKGSFFGLLNSYALLVGVTACALFVLHGSLYLWKKTEGEFAERTRRTALRSYSVFLLLYGAVLAATFIISPAVFSKAGEPLFWGVTALLLAALASIPLAIHAGRKGAAFLASSAAIALLVLGTAHSVHPVLVPSSLSPAHSLTIYNAASAPGTLKAVLAIASVGMAIVLCYTCAVYRVFRGPVRPQESGGIGH